MLWIRGIFHVRSTGFIRSEMWRFGGFKRLVLGFGLKPAKYGAQDEDRIFMLCLLKYCPATTLLYHLSILENTLPQPRWSKIDRGFKKCPFLKYLALKTWIHQKFWLVHNFQPNLASKALFWNSIVLIPSPPMDLGVQMLLQARRVRLCLLTWGKPYQSFLKLDSISWHSFWEKEEGHGVGGNCIGNCFHESSSPCLRKKFCLPTQESIQKFGFEIFKGKLFVLVNEEWDSKVFGIGGDLVRI